MHGEDPLAQGGTFSHPVGLVVNFEFRGDSLAAFETGTRILE